MKVTLPDGNNVGGDSSADSTSSTNLRQDDSVEKSAASLDQWFQAYLSKSDHQPTSGLYGGITEMWKAEILQAELRFNVINAQKFSYEQPCSSLLHRDVSFDMHYQLNVGGGA